MKLKIIIVLLFAFTLPGQAVQKCTDSDGRITYADFCPTSEPAKVENLYIPNTYDAEADHQAQENIRGMEESTRQSQYDRYQRNARARQGNTAPSTNAPGLPPSTQPTTSHRGEWQDERSCAYSCGKDPSCDVAVTCYGGSKRSSSRGEKNEHEKNSGVIIPVAGGGGCTGSIEDRIEGEFEGWDGESIFNLTNGQIWQQSSYAYTYHYAYRPEVLIYSSGGGCKMKVDGVSDSIAVTRLR